MAVAVKSVKLRLRHCFENFPRVDLHKKLALGVFRRVECEIRFGDLQETVETAPTTWSRFTRTKDGVETKFRIQEAPADQYDEVLDLFMKYHTPEEPLRILAGVTKNETALEEFRRVMLEIMVHEKQQILVCCLDNDDVFVPVGASKMALMERNVVKSVRDYKVQTEEVQKFFTLRESLYSEYNVLNEHSSVNAYFADRGLVVDPAYRGIGVAEELLKARAKVCKVCGITLYTGLATAVGSQKIAEKLGAKTVRELNLEDYTKDAGLAFTGAPMTVKLMVGRIPV